ncbi:MAG TPA: carboxypeptidase-like regulatory domain-containing protein, partial [Pirellulales bacterium]|nr:carboxypeptidase-like regulatory domain-containing protein [Pirellulales bacterium]
MSSSALDLRPAIVSAARRSGVASRCGWFLLAALTAAGVSLGQDEPKQAVRQDQKRVVRIFGVVRDSADRPVAEATVWLADSDARGGRPLERVSETRSDAEGAFSFFQAVEKNSVLYLIARDARGRFGWNASYIRPDHNTIRLYEVRDVRGRIVDGDGRPIAGARVAPHGFVNLAPGQRASADWAALFAEMAPEFETRTTADGGFELSKIPEQAHVRCEVSASGYGKPIALFAAKDFVTIKLQRVGRISGSLGPLAGVEAAQGGYKLRVMRQQQEQSPAAGQPLELNYSEDLTTAADGTFHSG